MVGTHMFKFLYKTLLISLISGSLTTMNMAAYAQDAAAGASANVTATAQMSKASSSGLTRDANGVLKKTDSHSFEGTKNENAIHVITMLAVGVIGTKLLMYKKWTTDMSVVAAASVAYIGAEIVNIMNLRNQLEDMNVQVTKSSDGKVDQAQIETLEKLKESYQKVQKSAKTKKMLQMAAAAAFGGAAAIAAWQRLSEDGQLENCQTAIINAQTQLGTCTTQQTTAASSACSTGVGCAAAVAFEKEALACGQCSADVGYLSTAIAAAKVGSEIPAPSMAKAPKSEAEDTKNQAHSGKPCTGVIAAGIKTSIVTSSCSTYLVTKKLNKGFGSSFMDAVSYNEPSALDRMLFANTMSIVPEQMSIDHSAKQRSVLQKMLDIFIPRAEAGMMAMLGLGVGAIAAFFTAKTAVGKTIDTYMFTPGGRIIAWGILAAAALMGAKATQGEIDKIEGHIAKIDQILKDMNTLKSGIKSNNVNEQQIKLASFQANANQDIPLNPNPNVKTDCIASSGSSNCAALSDTIRSMPGFTDLPDSFKSIASQSAKLGDGLSGANSISGSTLATAGALAGKQSAIAKLGNSLKSKINDSLAKSGKPKIDFDKEERDLWNKMKAQTSKALKGSGMSGGSFLSSTGISPISSTAPVPQMAVSKKPTSGFGSGAAALPAGDAKDKNKDFELDFSDTSAVADGGAMGSGADAKEEAFDIGTNDINTNTGDSIFQVISNRYIKSGYPKLLDEIPVKN